MLTQRYVLVLMTVMLTLLSSNGLNAGNIEEKKQTAVAASDAWLSLVDEGRYGESWEEASSIFREAVMKGQWEQMVAGVRGPLGGVMKRMIKSAKYMTTLPGAPDGEYVVIEYEASFEHKKSALETITPMKDKDGDWRVTGYYIK